MTNKKDRTLENYMKIGAEMRLYKTLGAKLAVDLDKVISAVDRDTLFRAQRKISDICSVAEENMFIDFPQLHDGYIYVFYGATNIPPRNEVDETVIAIAREVADELFDNGSQDNETD